MLRVKSYMSRPGGAQTIVAGGAHLFKERTRFTSHKPTERWASRVPDGANCTER